MRAQLRFLVLLACMCPSAVFGEEPEKIVKPIWFSRFSADSKLLATAHGGWDASDGGEARIWNAVSGKQELLLMVLFDFGMEVTGRKKTSMKRL